VKHLTHLIIATTAILLLSLNILGCSDDEGPLSPAIGTIHIVCNENLEAPWSLAGPTDYVATGTGRAELAGRPEGNYTITWGEVEGWETPPVETLGLCCDEATWFFGNYSLPPVHTADQLMQQFNFTYAGRMLDEYSTLLSSDFVFVSQGADAYGYDTELAIANKMFNEIAGEGGTIIDRIEIDQLEALGVWSPVPMNDPDFGDFAVDDAQYRPYTIELRFYLQGQNLIQLVSGHVIFYAIPQQNGGQTEYRLLGIKDQTFGGKATEAATWTNIKSQFI